MLRAYRLSRYSAGDIVAHIGARPKGLRQDQQRMTLVLLGACNPCGRRRPDGWNARMMERLRLVLRRVRFIEASGSLGRWSESMLAAPMNPRKAVVVARRFRQNAVVVISANRRSRLILLQTNIFLYEGFRC
jgi:uncharacterized protein DUF3293